MKRLSLSCVYMGHKTGDKKPCSVCTGTKMVDIYHCELHKECCPTFKPEGVKCCLFCEDRRSDLSKTELKNLHPFSLKKVDFYLTQSYIVDHWKPVYKELNSLIKGRLFTSKKDLKELAERKSIILVGSYGDYLAVKQFNRPIIYTEHGIGCTYSAIPNHNSFCDGLNRSNVELFLTPNQYVQNIVKRNHPQKQSVMVGTPKMDYFLSLPKLPQRKRPVIGFTFAWNRERLKTGIETQYIRYIRAIQKLSSKYEIIGHSHPLMMNERIDRYETLNIPYKTNLEDIFWNCDVLVADTTSALFEFASLNKPVVYLNNPQFDWSKEVYPTRFFPEIGVNVNNTKQLESGINEAIRDSFERQNQRTSIIRKLYPIQNSVEIATQAIFDYVRSLENGEVNKRSDRILAP